MFKSYLVTKKAMNIGGGKVRQVGELVPEAAGFSPRVIQVLLDSKEMVGVMVVTPREYKKLSQIGI